MAESSYRRTNEPSPLEVEPSTAGATSGGDLGELRAAMSFGLLAAKFASMPETWPVFVSFAHQAGVMEDFTRGQALYLLDVLRVMQGWKMVVDQR